MGENPLLIILGPTASGKTKLATALAAELNGEVISADSRQVYRGMDIGTGKDLADYEAEGQWVPYHLIDIKDAGEKYNVNDFKEDFYSAFEDITKRGRLPILCGGTGLYIHSLLQQLDYTAVPVDGQLRAELVLCSKDHLRDLLSDLPEAYTKQADLSSHKRMIRAIEIARYLKENALPKKERPAFSPYVVGLSSSVEVRRARINRRLENRMNSGLIEEVASLMDNGVQPEILEYYGLEYKFVSRYLLGHLSLAELKERLQVAIHQFAKRQMTFFRKMEKDGVNIHWYDTDDDQTEIRKRIIKNLDLKF